VCFGPFEDGQTERALPSYCADDLAIDDTGQRFQKQYSDDRLGSRNTLLSRPRVRRELINRLSRETVGTKRDIQESVVETDTFRVRPFQEIQD